MLVNLGLTESTTESAVERLPGEVSLAFSPYAGERLQRWAERARARGHEILLALPMEPINYPANDPGPHTLLVAAPTRENLDRLGWVLSRASGYVGVASYMGSRFTTSAEALKPVFAELKKRGLMFVDSRAAARSAGAATSKELDLPYAANDRYLDVDASREAIDARLREVELIARRKGAAVAIGFPHPVTIERLALWAESLEAKGLALAPITAVARVKDGS
ncbi:MAG: divergent polysaccharide deacetylase family protein [Alphaproteobacteria bacterium]